MEKLDEEEIYHLMDLLVMNTNNTKEQILLSDTDVYLAVIITASDYYS